MAYVIKKPNITVDGVDLSTHASSVSVSDEAAEVDVTAFGNTHTKNVKGLRSGSIQINFWQDFDAAAVDATLAPLNAGEAPAEVIVTVEDGVISATNPAYRLQEAHLFGYSPLAGGVGEASSTEVTFSNAGDTGLERLVAPIAP